MRGLRAVIAVLLFVLATIFRKGSPRTERDGVTQQRKSGGERRDVGGLDLNPTAQRFRSNELGFQMDPTNTARRCSLTQNNTAPT